MIKNLIKKCSNNWKFSAAVLIVSLILNIVLLCQPVFGTYTGVTEYKYSGMYFSNTETYQTTLSFSGGCATVNYTKGNETAYNAGVYQKIDDEIVIITSLTNPNGGSSLDTRRRVFTRDSVFSLSQGENQYTSISAIFIQIVLAVIELSFIIRLISQLKLKKSENNESNNSEDL